MSILADRAGTGAPREAVAERAAEIEPFVAADLSAVVALFARTFTRGSANLPALSDRIAAAYLRVGEDADLPSLVLKRSDGDILGFLGVLPWRMTVGDRVVRGALASSLMVDPARPDPLAGARLLRAFLKGAQDLSLGETASAQSEAMWLRAGGISLPPYSLDWVRVLAPVGLAVDRARSRWPAANLIAPAARWLDRRLRAGTVGGARWSRYGLAAERSNPGRDEPCDPDAFADLLEACAAPFPARPAWDAATRARIVRTGLVKPGFGSPVLSLVRGRGGAPIGGFAMHAAPGRVARVLQILAHPGQEGAVIDALLARAADLGACAVRGRSQPWLLDALAARRCVFFKDAASVVSARDPDLLEPFRSGRAFFNGFAGEAWLPLIGGE